MSEERFLFAISRIIFIFLLFFTLNSTAHKNHDPTSSCPPSSCGNITNISRPFRLKSDPSNCGYNGPHFELDGRYTRTIDYLTYELTNLELDCQNNQTIANVKNKTYFVQEIYYHNYSIRLVDPGINRENLFSCPIYSNVYDDWPSARSDYSFGWNTPVAFIHCLGPANSLKYVEAAFCGDRSSIFSNSSQTYNSYVMAGADSISLSDLEELCTVDRLVWVSDRRHMRNDSSLASIYDGLAYGMELSWSWVALCQKCNRTHEYCILAGNQAYCVNSCSGYICILGFLRDLLTDILTVYIPGIGAIAISGLLTLRFLCGFPFLVGLVVYKWRRRHLSIDENIEQFLKGQNDQRPIKYSYSEIKKMTNNFNRRLGEGGYGTVYKGKLRSGPYVAVKMMEHSMASEQEFISEVGTIGRIHHVNVVQLIGLCVEGSKCALVYEFLPNGSLDRYIFNQQGLEVVALTYEKMFEIALGVARGIDYLHCGCDMQILHFDIKPHNILLDEKFNPKISDFGLAKLYPSDGSVVDLTAARGTLGYMAPEMFYMNIGRVSYKADVYSFGMLLMEMAGRRKNMNPFADDASQIYFPSWVYDQFNAGKELDVEDATEEERKMIKKIIIVALWCIQMKPSDRPSMNKVVEMLEGDSELHMPPKPFLAPHEIADGH